MRGRSDRGNAILSTLASRWTPRDRAAAGAAAPGGGVGELSLGGRRLRVVSAHLDPRGPPGTAGWAPRGRERQTRHLISAIPDGTVVLGADLNLGRGRTRRRGGCSRSRIHLRRAASDAAWRHTFHALPRLVLDYLLVRDRPGVMRPGPGRAAGRAPAGPGSAGLRLRSSSAAWPGRLSPRRDASVSELLGCGSDLPWWGWALMVIGVIALSWRHRRALLARLASDDYTLGFDADPGSEPFVGVAAGLLNTPLFRGRQVKLLQNGDGFYPAMLEAIRGAKDTVNFEVYIFEPDEIGRQFMDAFMERARDGRRGADAGRRVRLVQAQAAPSGGARAGGREGRAVPAARAAQPGADLPAHPPAGDRDRRPHRLHRRRGDLEEVGGRRRAPRTSGATA